MKIMGRYTLPPTICKKTIGFTVKVELFNREFLSSVSKKRDCLPAAVFQGTKARRTFIAYTLPMKFGVKCWNFPYGTGICYGMGNPYQDSSGK